MGKLKVPSLQHLARNWDADPAVISRKLVALAKNGPTFSYEPLLGPVRDLLVYKTTSYEQIEEGIRKGVKREDVRGYYLDILPLVRDYFINVPTTFVHAVVPKSYSVGRGLRVPFAPPLIYGSNGKIHFPWFSFWRSNPLDAERLSLFVTIVEEVLLADSDLEDAEFTILDFSAPSPKDSRELTVVETGSIARLSAERKTEMLQTFVEGYILARDELAGVQQSDERTADDDSDSDQLQLDL